MGTWSAAPSLTEPRDLYTATLLPSGDLLIAAGRGRPNYVPIKSAEIYNTGLDFADAWRPKIRVADFDPADHELRLHGAGFEGISQASGGTTQDSSSNYPIVQLRRIDSGEVTFLAVARDTGGWSDTNFTSRPLKDFPAGPSLVTIFTNGIPSESQPVLLPRTQ